MFPDQAQVPVLVVVTLALPVAVTLTTRSWLPTAGTLRHTVIFDDVLAVPDG